MSLSHLKTVEKPEFDEFIRANLEKLKDKDTTGENISVMQYTENGVLVAQAIYSRPSGQGEVIRTYQIPMTEFELEKLC